MLRKLLVSFVIAGLLLNQSISVTAQPTPGTGLLFDDNAYNETPVLSPALSFAGEPPYYSLRKYCPIPGNQGNIGSCTGWATGYAALTIADAIRTNNTNTASITDQARSAMFIYLQIVEKCPEGSYIDRALALAKNLGVCRSSELADRLAICSSPIPSGLKTKAAGFRVKDFNTLFFLDATPSQKIAATRSSIAANKPVIPITAELPSSTPRDELDAQLLKIRRIILRQIESRIVDRTPSNQIIYNKPIRN